MLEVIAYTESLTKGRTIDEEMYLAGYAAAAQEDVLEPLSRHAKSFIRGSRVLMQKGLFQTPFDHGFDDGRLDALGL